MVKKAQVFSFISILIVLVFGILVTTMLMDLNLEDTHVEKKANSLDNYYSLIKGNYIETIVVSSLRSAFSALVNHTIQKKDFLNVDDDLFIEIFRNLSFYGNFSYNNGTEIIECEYCDIIMENNTLQYWSKQLKNFSEKIIYDISDISLLPLKNSINIRQNNPWFVDVSISFNISLNSLDFNFTDINYRITKRVPIDNLIDPLLGVYSNGSYQRKIIIDPDFYSTKNDSEIWTFKKLNETIHEGYYFRNEVGKGMSFLMRIRNLTSDNLSSDRSYIESFMIPVLIFNESAPFIEWNDTREIRNYIDHRFFNFDYVDCNDHDTLNEILFNINGISDQEKLLDFRIHRYDANRFLQGEKGNWSNYLKVSCSR